MPRAGAVHHINSGSHRSLFNHLVGADEKCRRHGEPERLSGLLDHFVCAVEQRRRHGEAERLRGLEIDHKPELSQQRLPA
jgi:hypothetical protein